MTHAAASATPLDLREPNARPRVVIVGSGFGGIAAARALRDAEADVTLVSRDNHYLFQPLLYQAATAVLEPSDIATASRAMLRKNKNTTTRMANVTGVDKVKRIVHVDTGDDLPYDYLVIATGADCNFFGHPEFADYCATMKSTTDALYIRERLLGAFELAEQTSDPDERRRLMTFVIVGAGPSGVETAGSLAGLAGATLAKDFRNINPSTARIILCEGSNKVLGAFPEKLSNYAEKTLKSLGVELMMGEAVAKVDAEGVVVGSKRIETKTVLWSAGTRARPAAQWLDAPAARNGAVIVEADCSVPGHPEIFAIGDVSQYMVEGRPLPGLGAVAKQQGAYVGKLLRQRIAKQPESGPFRYSNLGTMAIIGRSHAIAHIGGLQLTGFIAWLAWYFIHIMLLADARSRMLVYVNWMWSFCTYSRGARILIGPRLYRIKDRKKVEPPPQEAPKT